MLANLCFVTKMRTAAYHLVIIIIAGVRISLELIAAVASIRFGFVKKYFRKRLAGARARNYYYYAERQVKIYLQMRSLVPIES